MILFALTWDILGGQMGYNSLGNILFFGAGMYICTIVQIGMFYDVAEYTAHFGAVKIDFTPYQYYSGLALGLVSAALASLVLAVIFGWIVFGLRGPYFAIGTLGVAIAAGELVGAWDYVGGGGGISVPSYPGDPDDRALIPLTTSMSRLTHETHLHSIKIVTLNPSQVPETIETVRQVLRRNHNLSVLAADDFRFITPEGIMQWVTESEQALNRMLILISTVSLLVGGIVIMNILLVSIRERVREIGIRRCFGARRSDITLQFLFESVLVSLLGGVMGVGLGLAVSFALKRFDVLPTHITVEPFILSFVFCTLIGLIFGIHPARKAAFLSPEESIRSQ